MNNMREAIVRSKKPLFENLDKELTAIGDWWLFYTHPKNPREKDNNMLVCSRGVSSIDIFGAIIDLTLDYIDGRGEEVVGNPHLKVLSKIFDDLYNGKAKVKEVKNVPTTKK